MGARSKQRSKRNSLPRLEYLEGIAANHNSAFTTVNKRIYQAARLTAPDERLERAHCKCQGPQAVCGNVCAFNACGHVLRCVAALTLCDARRHVRSPKVRSRCAPIGAGYGTERGDGVCRSEARHGCARRSEAGPSGGRRALTCPEGPRPQSPWPGPPPRAPTPSPARCASRRDPLPLITSQHALQAGPLLASGFWFSLLRRCQTRSQGRAFKKTHSGSLSTLHPSPASLAASQASVVSVPRCGARARPASDLPAVRESCARRRINNSRPRHGSRRAGANCTYCAGSLSCQRWQMQRLHLWPTGRSVGLWSVVDGASVGRPSSVGRSVGRSRCRWVRP